MLIKKIELINVLSDTLDYLESNLPNGPSNHSKRTTLIALKLAKVLKLDASEISSLCIYALIHDCATSNEEFHYLEKFGRDELEKSKIHCTLIESITPHSIVRCNDVNIILYHHENWDGSGLFGKKGIEIPLLSQIIKLASDIEILYRANKNSTEIFNLINIKCNYYYSQKLVDTFNVVQREPLFYKLLKKSFIDIELKSIVGNRTIDINSSALIELTIIFKAILNTKSPFTNEHSTRVSKLAAIMAEYYNFDEERTENFVFAAIIHDVGKLLVPNSILNKKGPLTKDEIFIIHKHPIHTQRLLNKIYGLEEICNWASQHHEKLNGSGYPYGLKESELCFESQLLTVLDIYEALSADRPYRPALSYEKLSIIMQDMVNKGELNEDMVNDALMLLRLKKNA
ncbi:MAG: HD domain-containing protein [Spirochaetaceae bacterium]|nr:HD domain-containing protein [Spirochaetaceae bacterium]